MRDLAQRQLAFSPSKRNEHSCRSCPISDLQDRADDLMQTSKHWQKQAWGIVPQRLRRKKVRCDQLRQGRAIFALIPPLRYAWRS